VNYLLNGHAANAWRSFGHFQGVPVRVAPAQYASEFLVRVTAFF